MEKKDLYYKTKAEITYIIKNRLNQKDNNLIEKFKDDLLKNKIVEKFIEAGVDVYLLEKQFCEYFWNEYFLEKNNNLNNCKDYFLHLSISTKISRNFMDFLHTYQYHKTPYYVASKIYDNFENESKKVISKLNAIERYNSLSYAQKILEFFKQNNIKSINFDKESIEKINKLYLK